MVILYRCVVYHLFTKYNFGKTCTQTDMKTKGRNGSKPSGLLKGACADRRCELEYVACRVIKLN